MTMIRSMLGTAFAFLLAFPLPGQDVSPPSQPMDARPSHQTVPNLFGTQMNIMQIHAAAFHPIDSSVTWTIDNTVAGGRYMYATSFEGGPLFWAPVTLPTGTRIYFLDLYYYDNDPVWTIDAKLQAYSGTTAVDNVVVASSPTLAPGFGYAIGDISATPYMVNNDVEYGGGASLAVLIDIFQTGPNLKFRGVDIWWGRQVSPPPATATFSDVPTTSPQFKFVEALYAAGITAGCGGGKYCPNDPVTRGQMAVFLSQALGLHFPF